MSTVHTPNGAVEVAQRVGISYRQLDYWLRCGIIAIESDSDGSGSRRVFTAEEELALDRMVRKMEEAMTTMDYCRSGRFYADELARLKGYVRDECNDVVV